MMNSTNLSLRFRRIFGVRVSVNYSTEDSRLISAKVRSVSEVMDSVVLLLKRVSSVHISIGSARVLYAISFLICDW